MPVKIGDKDVAKLYLGEQLLSSVRIGNVQVSAGGGGPVPLPGQFNFKTSQFSKTKPALARVAGGTGRGKFVCVGDSTTFGEGSGTGGNGRVGCMPKGWPAKLAAALTGLGNPAINENKVGSSGITTTTVTITENRNSVKPGFNPASSGWILSTSTTAGGVLFTNTTDTTSVLSYAPTVQITKFELIELTISTGGSITYNVDGGAETVLDQSGASSIRRTIIDCGAKGLHTLNIKRVSGNAFVIGVRAWDDTTPAIDIWNLGNCVSQTSDWIGTANPWSALNAVTNHCADADLVFIDLTINNALLSPSSYNTTYPTQMQSIINAAKAGGADVLLMTGNPSRVDIIADSVQQQFRQALRTLATTNDLPMIDQYDKYTDWVTLNALGWMFNANHPNELQYTDLGTFLASSLKAWAV
ncbi:SGNH/GDSL hydrolase family protein [Rhizobium sp. N324]|uniref:SGNH/GDSL hydrolase family protein n=1 Tax=Rhizobium sp. N324 TaxID=1703969 RepID=UPI0007E99352|nr:SGNH/GDSL hydrolase family protein [Rhizobium sp. N324]ANM12029.1 SGNH family esterase protein [Rhizobium sp. N324]